VSIIFDGGLEVGVQLMSFLSVSFVVIIDKDGWVVFVRLSGKVGVVLFNGRIVLV